MKQQSTAVSLHYYQQAVKFTVNVTKSPFKAVTFYVCYILRYTIYLILEALASLEMFDAIASLALISCGQTFLGSGFLRIILITMDDRFYSIFLCLCKI